MFRLEITDKCNLSCEHCYIDKPQNKQLSVSYLKEIMPWFHKHRENDSVVIITGGEPTLNKELPEIIQLFAKNKFPMYLMTNGVFAEKEILRDTDFELNGSDFSEKIMNKIEKILNNPIGLEENIKYLKEAKKWKYSILQEIKKDNLSKKDFKILINYHLTASNFLEYINQINHKGYLKEIIIGMDEFHQKEREKHGYTRFALLSPDINSELEKKLKIELPNSSGQFPNFIGKAKNHVGYFLIKPGKKDRYNMLKKLYKTNFSEISNPNINNDKLQNLSKILNATNCLDNGITIRADKSVNRCPLVILPSIYDSNLNPVKDYYKIEREFRNNGGPLGVARRYGIPEDAIYHTLMNKGTCGVCDLAMKIRNQLNINQ